MRYFRHCVDAHSDLKIQKLLREFKSIGYAVYFLYLEMIGQEGYDGRLNLEKFSCEDAAHKLQDDPKVISLVLERIIEMGLFLRDGNAIKVPEEKWLKYADEWSSRKRKQALYDTLEASGEVSENKITTLEKYRNKFMEDVKFVLAHLNDKTGKQYRWQSKDNQILLTARLKEGYTKEDLCKVVDNMCERWMGDEKMEQYLRPTTLFCRSKVEGYLNADKGLRNKMKDWGKK